MFHHSSWIPMCHHVPNAVAMQLAPHDARSMSERYIPLVGQLVLAKLTWVEMQTTNIYTEMTFTILITNLISCPMKYVYVFFCITPRSPVRVCHGVVTRVCAEPVLATTCPWCTKGAWNSCKLVWFEPQEIGWIFIPMGSYPLKTCF